MPILIMLSLYFGLLVCTLLYLNKTNRIKIKTKIRNQQKQQLKIHKNNNIKHSSKRKQQHD
ncbi:hypothetical protein GA0061081_1018 [Gilliamella bombicola]|uniref:Uncharacterized protein n=1 Tax=Gilliamella bombicola TaxID=1798182 RepID=A0A1C3YNL5_9GAMM|nr:hypothetical protein GA0061081_1018 [Gilliamella bombicola]